MQNDEITLGERNGLCGVIATAREFADTEYQKRVWIDHAGPEYSWYIEAINALFDDYCVEEFAEGRALRYGFTIEMLERLRRFVRLLDTFDKTVPDDLEDEKIVALPDWPNIVKAAADFLDSAVGWLEANCSGFLMFKWSWAGKTFGTDD